MNPNRKRNLLAMAALCAATVITYSNSFEAGFSVDNAFMIRDPRIQAATAENLKQIVDHTYWWPSLEVPLYRPLTTLSYLWNYAIWEDGENPAGYHWINLLLHMANAVLAFLLALRLAGSFWPAAFAAGLWALHPALTESVTNIVGRSDLLAGMAVLGGLLLHLKSTEPGARRSRWLAGLGVATAIGVFSKESAVALAGAIAAYEIVFWRERKQWRGLLWSCAAMAPPILAMLLLRARAIASIQTAGFPFVDNPLSGADFWTARLTAAGVLAHYLRVLVFPLRLSNDYSYNQIPLATGSVHDWVAWAAVAAAAALCGVLYFRNRTAFFLAGFAFVTLVPTSNLIVLIGTIMAERFLYLPAFGFCGCLAVGVYALGKRTGRQALVPWVLGGIALVYSARTWNRNLDYRDDFTLWSSAVQAAPGSFKTHLGLAIELTRRDPAGANIQEVLAEAGKAVAIVADVPAPLNVTRVYSEAGLYYRAQGGLLAKQSPGGEPGPGALAAYRHSLALLERGVAIDRAGSERIRAREAARGKPVPGIGDFHDGLLYERLALTEEKLGNVADALRHMRFARQIRPENAEVHGRLVDLLRSSGQGREALLAAIEGALITHSAPLLGLIASLFPPQDRACAVQRMGLQEDLNIRCPAVFPLACEAGAGAERLFNGAGRQARARELRDTLVANGCPAGPLDAALREKP